MALVDDRTSHLDLPLPAAVNDLPDDVERLRQSFTALDNKAQADDDLHTLISDELTAHGQSLTDLGVDLENLKQEVESAAGLDGQIHGATSKPTLVDADEIALSNSAGAWGLVKATMANVKDFVKAYIESASLTIAGAFKQGALDDNGQFLLQAGTMEIGQGRTADGSSYIDLHGAVGTDYDARLIRAGGANGDFTFLQTGTGAFAFTAPNVTQFKFNGYAPLLNGLSATMQVGYDHATVQPMGATVSSGTVALSAKLGHFQAYQNGGAHTLNGPAENACSMVLKITNVAGAGLITIGVTKLTGDTIGTTAGDIYLLYFTNLGQKHCNVIKVSP